MPRPPSDRPVRIADAALEIIATSGLHAVTHRTIDARLGFPSGTTSYYARTRGELVSRALRLLAERFDEAVERLPLGEADSDERAVQVVTAAAMMLESQETEQIARFVLLIDLRRDDDLHPLINASSPAQRVVRSMTTDLMTSRGVPDAAQHAAGLLSLIDGLLLARLAGGSGVSIERAVATYWAGLPRA